MNQPARPKYFEFREGHACYAPIGLVSLQEATRLVKEAIAFAREHQIPRLLADLTQLTGFPSPSIPERYWIVREWAHSATSRVEVALVVQPYMIDPEHFGVLVAVNLGMRADVFSERPAALAWLLSGKPSSVQT